MRSFVWKREWLRLDEMKLTRTLFPLRVGYRNYSIAFSNPMFCSVFFACLERTRELWQNKVILLPMVAN